MKDLTMVKTLLAHMETELPPKKAAGVLSLISYVLLITLASLYLYLSGWTILIAYWILAAPVLVVQICASFCKVKDSTRYRLRVALGILLAISHIPWIIGENIQLDYVYGVTPMVGWCVGAAIICCYRWKRRVLWDETSHLIIMERLLNWERMYHQRVWFHMLTIIFHLILIVLLFVCKPLCMLFQSILLWFEWETGMLWVCVVSWLKLEIKKYV